MFVSHHGGLGRHGLSVGRGEQGVLHRGGDISTPLPCTPMSHQEGSCLPQSPGRSRPDEGLVSASLIPGSPRTTEFPCDSLSPLPCPVLELLSLEKPSRWLHGPSVTAPSYSLPFLAHAAQVHRLGSPLVLLSGATRLSCPPAWASSRAGIHLRPQHMRRALPLAWFLSRHPLGDGSLPQVPCRQALLTC